MNNLHDQQDDLSDRTEPCPQTRCRLCEQYYDKPSSNATDIDSFCSEFCESESADAERVR